MRFDIERQVERLLRIAMDLDAIAAEIPTSPYCRREVMLRKRLRIISARLRRSTMEVAEASRVESDFVAADTELDEVRKRLQSVLVGIPDIVWMKDAVGVYQSCNHAFERLIGHAESEILGKTDFDLRGPNNGDVGRGGDLYGAPCGEDICVSEKWVVYPDSGERRLMEVRRVPVSDANGNPAGELGVARDITERRRVEEALARREREYRTLVERSPDTIARYGRDLRRLYVNPTFASIIEGGAEVLLGSRPSECPGGSYAALYEQQLMEVIASGTNREFELHWRSNDGSELCHLVRLAPEFSMEGAVETILAVGRDITELHVSRERINRMAFYDPLTSLPNRTLFNERVVQAIGTGHGPCQLTGVMMLDLDRFKDVNDTFGHALADELLREAAERLRTCVRPCDTVARLGGDEFAVVLPDVSSRFALEEICRTIIAKFDERFLLDERDVYISCSIGIALHPVDGLEAGDLIKYADLAMYLAKRSGRRGFRFYSRDLTANAAKRVALEAELRRAIVRRELELHYQPKVSVLDNEVIGSEGLIRWRRPGFGLVGPNEFIPIAEETGLIFELGEWVLREACRTAVEWNGNGKACHKVAINLSAKQFQSPDLAQKVSEIFLETGCRAEWVEFEITESLLLEGNDVVQETLSTIKSMGSSIAIDDFGTGYSALSYLTQFPIDTLKIDSSFIRKATTDSRYAELIKAILSIARCFGQEVVAEGVETAEQAEFLRVNGCHFAQGYFYGRPVPKAAILSLPSMSLQSSHDILLQ